MASLRPLPEEVMGETSDSDSDVHKSDSMSSSSSEEIAEQVDASTSWHVDASSDGESNADEKSLLREDGDNGSTSWHVDASSDGESSADKKSGDSLAGGCSVGGCSGSSDSSQQSEVVAAPPQKKIRRSGSSPSAEVVSASHAVDRDEDVDEAVPQASESGWDVNSSSADEDACEHLPTDNHPPAVQAADAPQALELPINADASTDDPRAVACAASPPSLLNPLGRELKEAKTRMQEMPDVRDSSCQGKDREVSVLSKLAMPLHDKAASRPPTIQSISYWQDPLLIATETIRIRLPPQGPKCPYKVELYGAGMAIGDMTAISAMGIPNASIVSAAELKPVALKFIKKVHSTPFCIILFNSYFNLYYPSTHYNYYFYYHHHHHHYYHY